MIAQQVPAVQVTPASVMVRTLGAVAAICGLIIVGAHDGTLSAVQANRRLAAERAVFKVIPGASSIAEFVVVGGQEIKMADQGEAPTGALKFYAAYDGNGQLAGIAAEGAAKGYADTVRVMFSYAPRCQCIIGIGVVSMRETPGIGDKILTDPAFLANFQSLDARLDKDLRALANNITVVKHATKSQAWQIDAISGATITSRAVGKGINDAAQALLPKLLPNLHKIASKP